MVKLVPVDFDPFSRDDNQLAKAGINGDTKLIHSTPGDVTIPAERRNQVVDDQLNRILGGDLGRFTVGHPDNSLNPTTGLIQFEDVGGEGGGDHDTGGPDGSSGGGDTAGGVGGGDTTGGGTFGGDNGYSGNAGNIGTSSTGGVGSETSVDAAANPGAPDTGTEPATTSAGSETAADAAANPDNANTGTQPSVGFFGGILNGITDFISSRVQDAINNPVATALNIGIGLIPGVGQVLGGINTAVSIGSGGRLSAGKEITAAARDIFGSDNSQSSTSSSTGAAPASSGGVNGGPGNSSIGSGGTDTGTSISDIMNNYNVGSLAFAPPPAPPPIPQTPAVVGSTAAFFNGTPPDVQSTNVADIISGFNNQGDGYTKMLQATMAGA